MRAPRYHHDRPALSWVAGFLHQQRVVGYPGLIAEGTISQAAADRALRISNAIAADWTAIAELQPEPDWIHDITRGGAHQRERIDTLTAMATRCRATAAAKPDDPELSAIADVADALLWWETQRPSARFLADMTIALRARAAGDRAPRSTASLGAAA